MKYGDYILRFEKLRGGYINLYKNNIERSAFYMLAEQNCELVTKVQKLKGVVSPDFDEVVEETYYMLFVPIVKGLCQMNEDTIKALEDQIKFGTRITITTDEARKVIEQI